MSQINERAFETYVQEILLTTGNWLKGEVAEWDQARALFPRRLLGGSRDGSPI